MNKETPQSQKLLRPDIDRVLFQSRRDEPSQLDKMNRKHAPNQPRLDRPSEVCERLPENLLHHLTWFEPPALAEG